MRSVLRLFPFAFALIAALTLLVAPAAGQDMELMSVSAENCDYGGSIQSIEAVDELTVHFTLCVPDPALPSKAAFVTLGIHPSEYLEATGGGGDLLTDPIGTGPYMLENWDLGNEIVLTRFENYWGTPAVEPTAIFRWSTEAAQRLVELQAGTVDGIDNPAPGDFEVIRNDPNLQLFERPAGNIMYMSLNNRFEPFNDVNVRQAMAQVIDKQRIVDNFYPAGSSVADQFVPSMIFGHTAEVEPLAFDVALAEQMLDDAGYPRGADGIRFSTTLSYRDVVRGYLPTPGIVAQDIQAQLAAVGIEVEVQSMESGAFLDAALAGELPMVLLGWTLDYPDATNFFDTHFGSGAPDQFGDKFDEITEPLALGAQQATPEERYPYYLQANEAIRDLVPMVTIAHGGNGAAYQARIVNGHAQSVGQENLAIMEDPDDDNIVFMQGNEPISLYCSDESDGESFKVCEQIIESLLDYQIGSGEVIPGLAESWEVNDELTEWTFHLREGVTFHDGSMLDANDVVASYVAQWDAESPTHTGRTGDFTYFTAFFTTFINAPPPAAE